MFSADDRAGKLCETRENSVFLELRPSKDAFVRGSPNGMQSTGCNVAQPRLLQAARRITRDIMVPRPGKKADGNDEGGETRGWMKVQREMKGK